MAAIPPNRGSKPKWKKSLKSINLGAMHWQDGWSISQVFHLIHLEWPGKNTWENNEDPSSGIFFFWASPLLGSQAPLPYWAQGQYLPSVPPPFIVPGETFSVESLPSQRCYENMDWKHHVQEILGDPPLAPGPSFWAYASQGFPVKEDLLVALEKGQANREPMKTTLAFALGDLEGL